MRQPRSSGRTWWPVWAGAIILCVAAAGIHSGIRAQGGSVAGSVTFAKDVAPILQEKCEVCHLPGTYGLPLPDEALPTVITQDDTVISETLPTRSACMACHDTLSANVHAILASDLEGGVESCVVCHGPAADFAVQTVHALAP